MLNLTKDETADLARAEIYAQLSSSVFDLSPYMQPRQGAPVWEQSGIMYLSMRSLVTLVAQLLHRVNATATEETEPLVLTANGSTYRVPFDADRVAITDIVRTIRAEW